MKRLSLFLIFLSVAFSVADQRPNIVVVMVDDFGQELLSTYGGTSYDTPNLDQLSEDGMTFDICYATPLCSPTRNRLLSGKYNFRNYTTWGEYDFEGSPTFANTLGAAGYATAVCGKWHLGGWDETPNGPTRAGFQRYATFDYAAQLAEDEFEIGNFFWNTKLEIDGETERLGTQYSPAVFRDFAVDFIESHEESDQPFLLYYPMILCHRPFMPTDASEDDGVEFRGRVGSVENFDEMVAYVDQTVAAIRATLKRTGQTENTLLIFTADNGTDNVGEAKTLQSQWRGERVRGQKYFPTELGLNVPFIAVMPGQIEGGARYSRPIELTDVYATLCNLAEAKPPEGLDGFNLTPAFNGSASFERRYAYSWGLRERSSKKYKVPQEYADEILHIVRDEHWKYFSNGELFNLRASPKERKPVPDSSHPQVRKRMKEALAAKRQDDARLW